MLDSYVSDPLRVPAVLNASIKLYYLSSNVTSLKFTAFWG